MSKFSPKPISYAEINNGNRYELYDGVSSDAINAPIEASAYAQELAKDAVTKANEALDIAKNAVVGTYAPEFKVGFIYESTSPTSPAELYGGNWVQLEGGRTLVSAGGNYQNGATGGSETHTITSNEILDHKHNIGAYGNTGYTYISQYAIDEEDDTSYPYRTIVEGKCTRVSFTGSEIVQQKEGFPLSAIPEGTNSPFSIMQPYLVVYRWERLPD